MTPTAPDPHAEALRFLSAADPRLAELIHSVGPCRLGSAAQTSGPFHTPGFFEAIVESIVSQQLSVKASDTIFGRVLALGGGKLLPPAELLRVEEQALRTCGLSGSKVKFIRDLCEKLLDGTLVLDELPALDDEAVIEHLRRVKGIGRWTAEMFLIFRLGRPDVLPVADLGIQKGMKKLHGLRKDPTPERMIKLARPWRPYRSVACWYLWRLHETKK
ncbi:DNA-3-methyladenine glycosylase family protein [Polyangium jinanense]|uniref:DNA-3-methyladenine glycosylase II n=1 Tax=Polyangium jinanense TaxID=2829994 RepID=A0A9X4ASC7_9BACT|nr:DNA-3-methyladenine glycosylase [Polyangium jinanense]MDC3956132.1 DNA-3-methyladenine glycosylase 2 family protein [Polyangium jinanense]MDC3983033.1 DNA-3-methyladenine glycosylase 2 family protein [Polyangium jinanense]